MGALLSMSRFLLACVGALDYLIRKEQQKMNVVATEKKPIKLWLGDIEDDG